MMKHIETQGYKRIKEAALNYVKANKIGEKPGVYSKWLGEEESFYGSYHAPHIMDMFGELEKLPKEDIDAWVDNILQLLGDIPICYNTLALLIAQPSPLS